MFIATYIEPEFYSPLYLDCCGLVRRVLRDLRRVFGFRIGPWNQAYMFDTLPIRIDNLADVKPGDLVFISAIYYNEKGYPLYLIKHNINDN